MQQQITSWRSLLGAGRGCTGDVSGGPPGECAAAAVRDEEGGRRAPCPLAAFDLDFRPLTSPPPRYSVTLPISTVPLEGAGAFVIAISGGCVILRDDVRFVSVWHRLRHHSPTVVAPPPCTGSARVAAAADYATNCKKAARTQLCHHNLENASRLIVSTGSAASRRRSPCR